MNNNQWAITTLLWVVLTGYIYVRAGRRVTITSAGTPDSHQLCLILARLLLVSSFGTRYWTWRGIVFTTALCWGYAMLFLFSLPEPFRVGASGYPTIEYLVLAVLAVLPLWVHAIIHTTRVFLDVVGASERRHVRDIATLLLPIVPAIALTITLLPVAVAAGMVDAESFMPRGIGENWIAMVDMATVTWWSPRDSGSFSLVFVPLGLPAISCGLYLGSYFAWRTLCKLVRTPTRERTFLLRRQIFVTGFIHLLFNLCFGGVFLIDRVQFVP